MQLQHCRDCGQEFTNRADLLSHKKTVHNWTAKPKMSEVDSALAKFNEIQRSIHAVIRDLEIERQKYHDKIVEIDNIIVRYKKNSLLNRE